MPVYLISHHPTIILILTYQYLINESRFFYNKNYTEIGLIYKALQLRKVYKKKSGENSTYVKDIILFNKYYVLRTFVTKLRYMAY